MKKWLVAPTLIVMISIALAEVVLFAAARVSGQIEYLLQPSWSRNKIPDPELGYRMSPHYPGHDEHGYRNLRVPRKADVLAIGDSWTYGYAVSREDSWPAQLSTMTGAVVYNAGVGGYDTCRYKQGLERLLYLDPKVVIVGIMSNDFVGTYQSVYVTKLCEKFAINEGALRAELAAADDLAPFSTLEARATGRVDVDLSRANLFRTWLASNSKLYGLIRNVPYSLLTLSSAPFRDGLADDFDSAAERPGRIALQEPPEVRTVFVRPEWERKTTDSGDPRIREGLRITKALLSQTAIVLRARGIELMVVFFHGKISSYRDLAPEEFGLRLQADEVEQMFSDIASMLDTLDVTHLEVDSEFREMLQRGVPVYHPNDDGHPNAAGYKIIAKRVQAKLEKLL